MIGDLSGPSGGKIPGHRSHRSGRDADLLYFALTPAGEAVESPGFVRYGADGLAEVGPKLGGPAGCGEADAVPVAVTAVSTRLSAMARPMNR